MTPRKKHIIVKAYLEQKETHLVDGPNGEKIQLYIGRKYAENTREAAPVVCEVLSIGDDVTEVSVGDLIIVHHNMITNEAVRIEKNIPEQTVTLTLMVSNMLYAKINKETGELIPICDNLIAERIEVPPSSASIVSPYRYTDPMRFRILAVPEGYTDVEVGKDVLCYKLSDYEMVYNYNGKERRAIRIWKNDILAAFN